MAGELSTFRELIETLRQLEGHVVAVSVADVHGTEILRSPWVRAATVREAGDGAGWTLDLPEHDRFDIEIALPSLGFRDADWSGLIDDEHFVLAARFDTFTLWATEGH